MTNEAYVAKQVAKAAQHPKALLLGAIGAMCPTPSGSAKAAKKELGLAREEIQAARWVALFKREKTRTEFLRGLLEITKQCEENSKMEIKAGGRHNLEVLKSALLKMSKKEKIKIVEDRNSYEPSEPNSIYFLGVDNIEKSTRVCRINNENGLNKSLCDLETWHAEKIVFHLFDKSILKRMKKAAAEFEQKTNVGVIILEQY